MTYEIPGFTVEIKPTGNGAFCGHVTMANSNAVHVTEPHRKSEKLYLAIRRLAHALLDEEFAVREKAHGLTLDKNVVD